MYQNQKSTRVFNFLLWVAQALLAAGFIWAAAMKLFKPVHELAAMWPWTAQHRGLVTFTGILDLLAGVGLVLPALLRIWPQLTLYAAVGTIVLMITASVFHLSRGEGSQIGINVFFAVLAVFILWGRIYKAPWPKQDR